MEDTIKKLFEVNPNKKKVKPKVKKFRGLKEDDEVY